jgi:hypothetical protein
MTWTLNLSFIHTPLMTLEGYPYDRNVSGF